MHVEHNETMRASILGVAAVTLLSVACGKGTAKDTILKPVASSTLTFKVKEAEGFSDEIKKLGNLGNETTWAGYSYPCSIDLPAEASAVTPATFKMPSEGRIHVLVLKPVNYTWKGNTLPEAPDRHLARLKKEVQGKAGKPGVEAANGWIGESDGQFTTAIRKVVHSGYLFFSEKDVLQLSLRWPEGNQQAEKDAKLMMAHVLWSIKVKR